MTKTVDNLGKQKFRDIIKDNPIWGKAADAMAVLFPKAIKPELGIARHARFLLWAISNFSKTIIQFPRYHGKSTYVTFLYVMYVILTRQKKFILIVSATGNQAVKFLLRIKYYLTSKKIKHYYGDLAASRSIVDTKNESFDFIDAGDGKKRSMVWNFKEILIEVWGIRVMATSISSANRGLLSIDDRPDLIILDDIEDKKNTNTLELREKLADTIVEEILPSGSVDCQFIVIGTICHFGSFLLKLRRAKEWFFVPLDRATYPIERFNEINELLPKSFPEEYKFKPKEEYFTKDVIGLDGQKYKRGMKAPEVALWQEMYSYEYYCNKYNEYVALGKAASFWQEYYNIPKSERSRVITEFNFIQGLRFRYFLGEKVLESRGDHIFPNGKHMINVRSFLGGDLAVSEREGADWRVFVVAFTDPYYNVYILPPYKTKEPDPFVIAKYVLDQNIKYRFDSATFDGQHFQKWFKSILLNIMNVDESYRSARLRKIYQHSRYEKKEEVINATLSPLFRGERIYFVGEPGEFDDLINELSYLGYYNTDDHADALTYACMNLSYPDVINFDQISPVESGPYYKPWYEDVPEDELWLYV